MPQSIPRRFSITDSILLLTALAAGSALERFVRNYHATLPHRPSLLWDVERASGSYILMLAVFLLIARSLPPRPRLRRIVRQPGTIACVLIIYKFLRIEQHLLGEVIPFHMKLFPITPHGYLAGFSMPALGAIVFYSGELIGLIWLTMALARAWAPEPSWIDRSGRWLGWILILDVMVRDLVF